MSKKQSQKRKLKQNAGFVVWFMRHMQAAIGALGRLLRSPFSTLMTTAVIGIAIALPAGLALLIDNVRQVSDNWEGTSNISLFLYQSVSDEQAAQVKEWVSLRPGVAEARLVTKQQAMDEFQQLSGFGDALDLLEDNPLPAVVLVKPSQEAASSAEQTEKLADNLEQLEEVELAQVDLQWLRRFDAITRTIERGIYILAGLLCIAVLLVIGNTIRLEIQNRHSEIEIIKLVGGTDAFIRRPFLYEGIWYGIFGAAIALGLVILALSMLQAPVQKLAGLYQSNFDLSLINPIVLLGIILGGPFLGLLGSWVEVSRHLRKINPQM